MTANNDDNIYQAPESDLAAEDRGNIENVAKAQKLVIYAIVLYFAGVVLAAYFESVGNAVLIISILLGLFGVIKLVISLGDSIIARILYIILMFIPLVSLLVLIILNSRASARLREHGYKVGLFGRV